MAKVTVKLSELKARRADWQIKMTERKARHQARGNIAGVEKIERWEAELRELDQMIAALEAGKMVNHYALKEKASILVPADNLLDIEIVAG